MNETAYGVVLLMPVAIAKMFASRMMSSGLKPTSRSAGRRPAAARHPPLDRFGLALLVEGHDDDRRPVAPAEAGLAQELGLALLERRSS
jgi:hypothetical protein